MREWIVEVFANYSVIIIFLHVFSAVIWVGGMIAIKYAVAPSIHKIEEPKVRISRTLEFLQNFFYIVTPAVLLLAITSVFLNIGFDFRHGNPMLYIVVQTKELVWTIMAINFIYIFRKRNSAQRAFVSGDTINAKNELLFIANYLIPVNLFLGILEVAFGVVLRVG